MADLDDRVLLLETAAKVTEGELGSLRASRQEFGNWLNRHNLEINALSQRLEELYMQRLSAAEKTLSEVRAVQALHATALDTLAADAKLLAWKIGSILAGIVFVANQLANRIHF
jgi:hypothetical protein